MGEPGSEAHGQDERVHQGSPQGLPQHLPLAALGRARGGHTGLGAPPTSEVAPRRLLKTLDQGYPRPTSKVWQLGTGTSACRLLSSGLWLGRGGWVAGRVLGRRCTGLADSHGKQLGPGLRLLGGGVTAALVQAQPGPAVSRVTPNAIQGAGCSKISSLLAEGVPPWSLGRPVCPRCPFGTRLSPGGGIRLAGGYF